MELLTSALLSARHGFPTRGGGASSGPFATLNLSYSVGDAPQAVAANLAQLEQAAGVAPGHLVTVNQVHGDRLVEARVGQGAVDADALWTEQPGVAVGVRTADCLPILIEDPRARRVAAVHAGWRGVVAELVTRTIEALVAHGSRVGDLRLVVGPAIQRCCFEVDDELATRFAAQFGGAVVHRVPGKVKPHLDLGAAVQRSIDRAGVPPGHVAVLPQCTMCDARFFSHRRERGITGRHLSFITTPGSAAAL